MLLTFDNVPVMPFTYLLDRWKVSGEVHQGGPLWPDWHLQVSARHCRRGIPVDVPPAALPVHETIEEPAAWGGPIIKHFGHQVAEFSMRIVPTLESWADAEFVFAAKPESGIVSWDTAPAHFAEVLGWLGVPRDRVRIITRPTLATRLAVAPQAEQWGARHGEIGPTAGHLDAMDALVERRLGKVPQRGTIYVSRAAQRWRCAGERELERAFVRSGVEVMRPEDLPLSEQLRRYASADRLIFAEGSALHGLQLLGRGLGDVIVLPRRIGFLVARASLLPRARSIDYLDTGLRLVHGLEPTGVPATNAALSVPQEALLLDGMERLGIPLRAHWDSHAYAAACEQDARDWLTQACEPHRLSIAHAPEVICSTLEACGLGHLVTEVEAARGRLPGVSGAARRTEAPDRDARHGGDGASSVVDLRETLLQSPPSFHLWGGAWQVGGFGSRHLLLMERLIRQYGADGGVAYETGAGLSSAWLLSIGMREVRSFCIDPEVCARIEDFLHPHRGMRERWHVHLGPSQLQLPVHAIATSEPRADFCLIDGGHALDQVFTDFMYLNYVLKQGGLLAVDDLQLGSCRLLVEALLQPSAGYVLVGRQDKLAVLRKIGSARLGGDVDGQSGLLSRMNECLGDVGTPGRPPGIAS